MARRRRRSSGKKRTLSPEQLEKMREGRERKQKHAERMESIKELQHRLYVGEHNR